MNQENEISKEIGKFTSTYVTMDKMEIIVKLFAKIVENEMMKSSITKKEKEISDLKEEIKFIRG